MFETYIFIGHVSSIVQDGESLLFVACKNGLFDIVKFLVVVVKSDTTFENSDGISCLGIASRCGHQRVVEFLILVAGTNPEITDKVKTA